MQRSPFFTNFRLHMALAFAFIFLSLAVTLTGLSVHALVTGLLGRSALIEALVEAINMAVIALAMFELGMVVNREYRESAPERGTASLRRTVTHFVGIVCIALVLEGLLMVIKYSQLELAGNLYYPVAIISSAAVLLAALGVFLRLTREPVPQSRGLRRAAMREASLGERVRWRERPAI